jgi:DNA-binding transcriptional regulator YdaS (Cro superfamily)
MKRHIKRDPGVEHAIEKAGGTIAALAHKLGLHPGSVRGWPQVPAERVLQIERAVPGADRHILRADLYPRGES